MTEVQLPKTRPSLKNYGIFVRVMVTMAEGALMMAILIEVKGTMSGARLE